MAIASEYDLECVESGACKVAAHNAPNTLALLRQVTASSAGSAVSGS